MNDLFAWSHYLQIQCIECRDYCNFAIFYTTDILNARFLIDASMGTWTTAMVQAPNGQHASDAAVRCLKPVLLEFRYFYYLDTVFYFVCLHQDHL